MKIRNESGLLAYAALFVGIAISGNAFSATGICRGGISNPERGFRFEQQIGLVGDEGMTAGMKSAWRFDDYAKDGVRIAQAYCYLTGCLETDIPQVKLVSLQKDFDRARMLGVKFLLRFAYERDVSRRVGPTSERILSHIRQLTPIVQKNADVIYVLQIGWIGAWGEFHSSARRLDEDEKVVADVVAATLDMLPENRMTMMRLSRQRTVALRRLGGDHEVTAETAWSATPPARIGFFNDATLANCYDAGTFLGDYGTYAKMSWADVLEAKLDQPGAPVFDRMARESAFVPVDGELFWTGQVEPLLQGGLVSIQRLRRHHYTTFSLVHGNSELDKSPELGAIDTWKVTPITRELLEANGIPCDPDYFSGVPYRTAYEYIRDHLGYRLVVKKCERRDGKVRLTVHNYGFAAPVNRRKAYFAILAADGAVTEIPTDFDCRRFAAESDTVVECDVPALKDGERLALWLPDELLADRAEYAIRLAGGAEFVEKDGKILNMLTP